MADRPQLESAVVDGWGTGNRKGIPHNLGGAARAERGRNRRKRRRDHHAAAGRGGLIDGRSVLDSGSTADTEIRALAAGARVISREVALPEVEPQPGKGEV